VGLGEANIAASPQIKTSRALRDGAFHPGPEGVRSLELICLLTLPGGPDRLVWRLGLDRDLARRLFGRCARRTHGTRQTGRFVKPDANDRYARLTLARRPFDTAMSLRTGGPLSLPIHHEGR